jgi:Trk-type K+ transport system membrane component
MALKIAKGVWFVSLMIFLAIFFYNYASLAPSVTLVEGAEPLIATKEGVFYGNRSVAQSVRFSREQIL